jgi:phage gpG-like protein
VSFFELKVEHNLSTVLRPLQAKAQALPGMLPVIAELLVAGVADVFEAEGPGWRGLEDSTLANRRKSGAGAKILQDSGMMAGSVSPAWSDTFAEAMSLVSYDVYHVSPEPRRKIPLRDFYNLGPFEGPILDEAAELILSQMPP